MDPKTRNEVIATLRKMKREDLVQHVQKPVVAQQEFYAWMHKAVAMTKGMVKTMIREHREDEIAETLAAIVKSSLPQQLQDEVMKELRSRLS